MVKKNEIYIWIALGIGGLYLLTRTDEKKGDKLEITVTAAPTTDFGGGRVGGEPMTVDDPEPSAPEHPVADEFDNPKKIGADFSTYHM